MKRCLAVLWMFASGLFAQDGPEPLATLLRQPGPAATAELEKRFDTVADRIDQRKIAAVLVVRLEDDDRYFDFLASRARRAVGSDMPFPASYNEDGRSIAGRYSAEFLAWTAARKISPDVAAAQATQEFPLDVFFLALTNDPRGEEILRQGVWSKNPLVAYRAAWGLARLRRADAIPAIIAAAEHAPREAGLLIARALVLFPEARAQAAAERIVGDRQVLEALRAQAERELSLGAGDF